MVACWVCIFVSEMLATASDQAESNYMWTKNANNMRTGHVKQTQPRNNMWIKCEKMGGKQKHVTKWQKGQQEKTKKTKVNKCEKKDQEKGNKMQHKKATKVKQVANHDNI